MKKTYYHAKNPRKNKKRQYKEHEHQVAIFKQAAIYEPQYPLLALLQGSLTGVNLDIIKAKRAKDAGVKAGFPDINLPVARGGYNGLYIELKTAKGSVRPDQDRIMGLLDQEGHLVLLLKDFSSAEVFDIIMKYLAGKIVRPVVPSKEVKPDDKKSTQLRDNRDQKPLQIQAGEDKNGKGPGV